MDAIVYFGAVGTAANITDGSVGYIVTQESNGYALWLGNREFSQSDEDAPDKPVFISFHADRHRAIELAVYNTFAARRRVLGCRFTDAQVMGQ